MALPPGITQNPCLRTSETQEPMSWFQVLKHIKRLKHIETYLGSLGFYLIGLFCLLGFFVYLNYFGVVVNNGNRFHGGQSQRVMLFGFNGSDVVDRKVGFLDGECDLFEGDWVWDEKYPLYQSRNCRFLDDGFRCSENGRPDNYYTHWRWQPKDCNIPRFDARTMLEKLRNRRIVFVGDSIGRNQWESLLCMLSSVIIDKDSIYEVNGSPITKHKGFLVFKFKDFNCTVEYYRAPFLVVQSRPPVGVAKKVKTTLKLDTMDWTSVKWRDADVLVFNTGHWWNYEKTLRGGCYFQEGNEVKMKMSIESAYKKSIETLVNWIDKEVNSSKTQIFFRTYAPVHFRGGDWRNGGSCHMETLPELGSSLVPSGTWDTLKTLNDVLEEHSNNSHMFKMDVLNVTLMSSRRKDGHLSLYYLGPKASPAPVNRQDCSHWCLPGVPDVWNELLYAFFLKHETLTTQNSTLSSQAKLKLVQKAS